MEEPLEESGVIDAQCVLTCTKHLWQWDLNSMTPTGAAEKPIETYACKVEGGHVLADVDVEIVYDFEEDAVACGDDERVRLARVHHEAYEFRQTDPDRMLRMLEDGRRLAVSLQEPWWVAFFDHWKLETLIYYKDDYREVIELGVRLTLELRKPAYEGFPLNFCAWCNLVSAYLCVDPRGYAPAIREAIEYLGTVVPWQGGDRYLLQARRHWFAYELGALAEAQRLAEEELAMADADPDRHTARHHEVDTYKALCWIAYGRKDWEKLAAYAATGEERARTIEYRYELSLFLLWEAVVARRAGRGDEAARKCRQGVALMGRLGQPPGESYFDALSGYHELGEEWPEAWQVRERELASTVGKGQLAYECNIRLKRLRLARRMGMDHEAEAAAARESARRLRAPGWYLGELDRLLTDSFR